MSDTTKAAPVSGAIDSGAGQASPFSIDQLQQIAQWEVEAGRLTPDQADAMLSVDGVRQREAVSSSAEAAEVDAAFPPAEQHQYELPPLASDDVSDSALIEYNKTARGWLHAARFDQERGSSLAKTIAQATERAKSMAAADRELHKQAELAKLERIWGDQAQSKIKLARQLVREIENKSPGLVDILESGAGNDALVIKMIAEQAELLALRKGG